MNWRKDKAVNTPLGSRNLKDNSMKRQPQVLKIEDLLNQVSNENFEKQRKRNVFFIKRLAVCLRTVENRRKTRKH